VVVVLDGRPVLSAEKLFWRKFPLKDGKFILTLEAVVVIGKLVA